MKKEIHIPYCKYIVLNLQGRKKNHANWFLSKIIAIYVDIFSYYCKNKHLEFLDCVFWIFHESL